jgi:hypothetical protein
MILNHKAAIQLLVEQADEIGFNPSLTFRNAPISMACWVSMN